MSRYLCDECIHYDGYGCLIEPPIQDPLNCPCYAGPDIDEEDWE